MGRCNHTCHLHVRGVLLAAPTSGEAGGEGGGEKPLGSDRRASGERSKASPVYGVDDTVGTEVAILQGMCTTFVPELAKITHWRTIGTHGARHACERLAEKAGLDGVSPAGLDGGRLG